MRGLNVRVLDALCGAGKTTWAIKHCKEASSTGGRFVYITPTLEQVQRVLYDLAEIGVNALQPSDKESRKLQDFHDLLEGGHNVVSTHSLFELVNETTKQALLNTGYVLVIDEVTEWLEEVRCSRDDQEVLLNSGLLKLDEDGHRLSWQDRQDSQGREIPYKGAHARIRSLARQDKLMKPQNAQDLLVWEFPVEFLGLFEEVWILTHLFEGSDMKAYLEMYGQDPEKFTMNEDGTAPVLYHSTPGKAAEAARVAAIKPLITVINDQKLNAIGNPVPSKRGRPQHPLSDTWFNDSRNKPAVEQLGKNLNTLFRHRLNLPADKCLWATYKDYKHIMKSNGFSESFATWNTRATNSYVEVEAVAYCVNLNRRPPFVEYFMAEGLQELDKDSYALTAMVQFIFRARIRKKAPEPITVYIPSQRMRGIFLDWLNGTYVPGAAS